MFLSDCHICGRRELRGPRSLSTDHDGAFVTTCRSCGSIVPVAGGHRAAADDRTPRHPAPAAA